jgi:hypothetical protein
MLIIRSRKFHGLQTVFCPFQRRNVDFYLFREDNKEDTVQVILETMAGFLKKVSRNRVFPKIKGLALSDKGR